MLKTAKLASCLGLLLLLAANTQAQGIYATLTGVVTDPSGSVMPQARVVLKDALSGSERETATNNEGYYTFASVPVGNYTLTVVVKGFQTYKADGIGLGGGEQRGGNVTLAGGHAAQYIKITPVFSIENGTSNKANYSGQTIGINANGDSGSQSPLNAAFAYNGLPTNTLDIVADRAHVSDPGCNCDTPVNPNSDFLQEFKVLTSNFSAETQKGPAVITSVTKAGGSQYHGSGFFSARNHSLNANDWLNNFSGVQQPAN